MAGGVVRVAHVMHGLMMGGLEQVVIRLCEAGRRFGIEPHVIAYGADGSVREALREREIPLTWLGDVAGMRPRTLYRLAQVLRANDLQVVHAHDVGPWLNALAASALVPGLKSVATFHQVAAPRRLKRIAAVGASRFTGALVACGEEVLSCLQGWAPSGVRLELIGNGVPMGPEPSAEQRRRARADLGIPHEAKLVGYLGRLHFEKGVDLLVDAFLQRFHARPDVHLALIGRGALEGPLRQRAAGHPRIHFLGERQDAGSLLPALDVYVQPSRREGRSLAMLEAMAAGLPTVAQDLPAIREIHLDAETALLVPASERPDLGAAMVRLLEDEAERKTMGQRARAHVQRFSLDTMVERYAALYQELLGATAPLIAGAAT